MQTVTRGLNKKVENPWGVQESSNAEAFLLLTCPGDRRIVPPPEQFEIVSCAKDLPGFSTSRFSFFEIQLGTDSSHLSGRFVFVRSRNRSSLPLWTAKSIERQTETRGGICL